MSEGTENEDIFKEKFWSPTTGQWRFRLQTALSSGGRDIKPMGERGSKVGRPFRRLCMPTRCRSLHNTRRQAPRDELRHQVHRKSTDELPDILGRSKPNTDRIRDWCGLPLAVFAYAVHHLTSRLRRHWLLCSRSICCSIQRVACQRHLGLANCEGECCGAGAVRLNHPRRDLVRSIGSLSGFPSHSLESGGGAFLTVIFGQIFAYSAFSDSHFSSPGSVSGLIASTGHSGTQTPQSMHSSGWMTSMFSPS